MSNQRMSFLIIGLIVGIIIGFGGNHLSTQPKIQTLNQELENVVNENTIAKTRVENLTSSINTLSDELEQKTNELGQVKEELSNTENLVDDTNNQIESIASHSDRLTKIKNVFEALNAEYPNSEASQILWRQNVLKECGKLNTTLRELRDRYEADSEAARLIMLEEPSLLRQQAWINWVLEWFDALEPVNESGDAFKKALYDTLLDELNELIDAMK